MFRRLQVRYCVEVYRRTSPVLLPWWVLCHEGLKCRRTGFDRIGLEGNFRLDEEMSHLASGAGQLRNVGLAALFRPVVDLHGIEVILPWLRF